ncbi:MAG: hypothetical protein ACOYOR_06590 [Flavobacterium psychrophilum]
MEMRKFTENILSMNYSDGLVDVIKTAIQSFQSKNQTSITNYDNWKINCEKEEYLKNPDYKIYQLKNRNSIPSVVANVKWKYLYDGEYLKNKATMVYLGNITQYPDLENDKLLLKNVNGIITNHFNLKSPQSIIDPNDLKLNKDGVELYYYWKNKLIELEYRLSPIHYLSQSKNDNPEQKIINIKWGFEVMGKSTKPRYILKRYSVDKRFIDNLDNPDLDYKLKQIVKEHISTVCPVFFDPPNKN